MTITRREVLRGALGAAGAAVLAACGISAKKSAAAKLAPLGSPAPKLSIATWPLYIDVDEKTKKRPTVEQFQAKTHIRVDYREVIDDNDPFFGTIREPLSRGRPTGWDIVVVTDWLSGRMQRLGYLEQLHPDKLSNVMANASDAAVDRNLDKPLFAVPWQAGITGIGYNPKLTKREITSFGDLFDPAFKGKVGMLSDMRDMIHLTLLWMGIDPSGATIDQVKAARDKLVDQRHKGLVRGYYQNDYTDALARGDVAITLAYSGDIFQLQANSPDLRFVVPKEGGMLFFDEMVIPKGAANPAGAHEWMDFVYQPKIAAQIAAAVQYITPVPAAQDELRKEAAAATGEERTTLERIASSSLVFPTADMQRKVHRYRVLTEDEEKAWNDLFAAVVQS